MLRRGKSIEDAVLERNLCFIDTPGYGNDTSVSVVHQPQCTTVLTACRGDGDVLGMLSGHGGSHVDVVLYIILHRKSRDKIGKHGLKLLQG